ncbi:MAG: hypothetical protein JST19_20320 [Bacteroidetes bacterium]|nr:hypothetical protein [Bacteroidota bacterium]
MNEYRQVFHEEVFDCKQASDARQIKLKQELKTILLRAGTKKMALHLRGCDRINFRAIKHIFKVKDITFILPEELAQFNLSKGTINPWNIGFCTYNLVCLKVFYNRFLATNHSVTTTGIVFQTTHILQLPNPIFGNFSHGDPNLPAPHRFDC